MPDGLVALTGLQVGIEETRGTPVEATRIQPATATMKHMIERYYPTEDRNSFEEYFRSSQTRERVEISGVTAWATFEDLPWWLQLFAKGGVEPTGSGTYTWEFLPTAEADDLATATFECFTDTTAWQVPFVVGNKLEIGWQRGQPVSLSMDFLGQTATTATKTPDLAQRLSEDITDGLSSVYIDDATIGTSLAANVLSAKATIANNWEPIYTLNGTRYPSKFVRGRRHAEFEAVIQFDSTDEYEAFLAGTPRIIRVSSSGSGSNQFDFDLFSSGWDAFDFGRQGGIWTASLKTSSTYSADAGASWSATVVNAEATLDPAPGS